MKRLILIIGILSLVGCQTPWRSPSSSSFKPMAHMDETLGNGLNILWIPDEKLPAFSVSLLVGAGSSLDPKGKAGVASTVASLLDKGTSNKSATQIAADLEQLGISFSASADEDSTSIGISGLSLYSKEATDYLFALISDPQFSNEEVNRQKSLLRSQISKALDRPSTVATVAFDRYLFGQHAYGQPPSISALNKISRADLQAFHKEWYQPHISYMAVVGRFTKADQDHIRKTFGAWKSSGIKPPVVASPQPPKPGVIYVEKSGLKQAEIRIGHLGVPRNNKDYLKLRVANTILGESFIGRLFTEIRVKRGLTYSIYSRFSPMAVEGSFVIGTFTRLDKINEMVKETLLVYNNFTQGVTDGDVKDAISYLRGSFPQVIETGDDLARQMLILKRYGVDVDYLSTFMAEISKLKPEDVNSILKTYFKPDQALIVVYGPPGSGIGLEQFGPVTKVSASELVK